MSSRVKDIVIVGGGTAGWMCAAAFSNSFGASGRTITLVESESIGTVGVGEATIPMILLFNKMLKIDEDDFIKATNATFKLGIAFENWKSIGHSYFHPFGNMGVDMEGVPFSHFWQRWSRAGGSLEHFKFNVEAEAAQKCRFAQVRSAPGEKTLPDVNYAYQFDASLYAKFLRKYSEDRGVKRIEGKINGTIQNSDSGCIEILKLADGSEVKGDFFIDCSGFRGLLIEDVFKAGYENWSQWLPVNKAVAVPCESAGELLPYTKSIARNNGWQWRIPLQHRTGNGYVYCDEYTSDDEATNVLLESLDGKPIANPKVLSFTTGVRKKSWVKNVVSIGLSSGFIEPLESTSIHLIQRAIWKILAMFPQDREDKLIADRFNADMKAEYEDVKDFIIAHYKITEREDTAFWKYVKNMDVPDSLSTRLAIFRERGEILVRQEELFKEANWFFVLFGQGLIPKSYHPVADAISEDELKLRLTKIRSGVQKRVEGMMGHEEFIQKYVASPRT